MDLVARECKTNCTSCSFMFLGSSQVGRGSLLGPFCDVQVERGPLLDAFCDVQVGPTCTRHAAYTVARITHGSGE